MPDWLMKIFTSIVSVKSASIALLTCISLIIFWSNGSLLIKDFGLPESYIPYFLIIILYSISHIIVIGSIRLWELGQTFLSGRSLVNIEKVRLEDFRGGIKIAIPHLPYKQMKILKQLSLGERAYNVREDGIYYLEKQKFIKRLQEVSLNSFIFEIDPLVKSELSEYIKSKRVAGLKEFAVKITEEEKRFLSLFFVDVMSEGTRESGKMMENNIFESGVRMANKDFLEHFATGSKTSNIEGFRLYPETEEILERVVFNKSCARKEICLDTNFIYASRASGGGATGY